MPACDVRCHGHVLFASWYNCYSQQTKVFTAWNHPAGTESAATLYKLHSSACSLRSLTACLFLQVIAGSGAGLDTYDLTLPNGTVTVITGVPDELPPGVNPPVPILFGRQVAADNTSIALNSTWIPQVRSSPCLALLPLFSVLLSVPFQL